MPKLLYIIIPLLGLLFLANHAQAGIIIRPVINTGLVGYWSFNEGTGTKVGDMSGYGNHGTWSGTGSHWVDGKIGKAGNFNGADDYIDTNTEMGIDGMTEISVCAWMYWAPASVGKDATIVTKWDDSDQGMMMWVDDIGNISGRTNTISWTIRADSSTRIEGSTNLVTPQNWDYYCGVFKGSSFMRLYKNGILDQEITSGIEASVQANTANVRIGRGSYTPDPRYFDGKIDEVRIYNRDLDASEITKLYKSGLSKIGINQLGLVPDDLPANATVSYVREDCTGYSPCYNSLFDWEAAWGGFDFADHSCGNGDLTCLNKTAVARIDGIWNSPDTASAPINGWITDATRYISIYTTASARHPGKWDETKYRMEVTDIYAIGIGEEYTRIDGLQIKMTVTTNYQRAIISDVNNASSDVRISSNIIRGVCSAPLNDCAGIANSWNYTGNYKIWNNILYDLNRGIYFNQGATAQIYNNIVVSCNDGYMINGTAIIVAKNNLAYNNIDNYADYGGSRWDDYSTNNLSGPSSDTYTPSANARNGVRVNFVDEANDDFHLSPADSGARNYGVDLSNDTSISYPFDIDRQDRKGTWDIGADEARGTITGASQANQITNGLVGYWPFNGPDIDGNTAYDRSTGGNNGTIIGATPTDGKVGQALSFDGVNDYINCGHSLDGLNNTGMSVSAWIKPISDGGSDMGRIADKDTGMVGGWWFGMFGTALRFLKDGTTDLNIQSNIGTITLNQWQHVLVTWDGSTTATNVHFYINGTETTYSAQTSGASFNSDAGLDLDIGARDGGGAAFDGKLDEIRIYNRILEPEEIKRLYNLGR